MHADEIMVCAGASDALSTALAALIDPGDEIIVPTPLIRSMRR